mmetsp:Transcript_65828/g.183389  ORF Transcript_65828/g.183389 Transcript_65828/m.183389 type:complete len:325 (-) Transcript_65828:32-1006(-)
MAFSSLVEFDGGTPLLQVLMWVPSVDAFRASMGCQALQQIVETSPSCEGDASYSFDLWRHLSREGTSAGSHRQGSVWLHGLMLPPRIASYLKLAQRFTVLQELRFKTLADFDGLVEAIHLSEHCRARSQESGDSGGELFVSSVAFEAADVAAALGGTRGGGGHAVVRPILSGPLRFCWTPHKEMLFSFELRLRISPGGGDGRVLVSWEPRFVGEASDEERDCIELHVAGALAVPCEATDPSGANAYCLRPWYGTLNGELAVGPRDPASSVAPPESPICEALLEAPRLTCTALVLLRSLGVTQPVKPLHSAQASKARCWHSGTAH